MGWLVAVSCAYVLAHLETLADGRSGLVGLKALSSVPVVCNDLKVQAARARGEGKVVVADVTDYGPEGCPAVRLGAHVSVMRMAERLCVVAASKDAPRALPSLHAWLDERAAAEEAQRTLALQALDREALRWHMASDAAQVVACYLRCHPKVGEVRYPGLKQDGSFAVASRTLQQGFGPRVDYRLAGSDEWQSVRCDSADPRDQVLALEDALRSPTVLPPHPAHAARF